MSAFQRNLLFYVGILLAVAVVLELLDPHPHANGNGWALRELHTLPTTGAQNSQTAKTWCTYVTDTGVIVTMFPKEDGRTCPQ